jgi:hypothetical protein
MKVIVQHYPRDQGEPDRVRGVGSRHHHQRGPASSAGALAGAAPHLFDLKIFAQQAGAVLAEQGPVFADLKMVSSGPQQRDYTSLHGPHVRKAFKDALAAG